MKHVTKGTSPATFETWKARTNENWVATYDNLQNPEKQALHESLLSEQGWVCCYCGRAISVADSHIEHFRPQATRPDLSLVYENLHTSCIREVSPNAQLHCGHAKADKFDEALCISPLDSTCERRFIYKHNGEVSPTNPADECATHMLKILELNAAFLRNRRAEALQKTFDENFLASTTSDELRTLRDAFRSSDSAGRTPDFGHVIARFAEQRLEDDHGSSELPDTHAEQQKS